MSNPYGTPGQNPRQGFAPQGNCYPYPMVPNQSWNVLSIVAFILSFIPFFSLIGLVLAIVALVQINTEKHQKGQGLAIAATILSVLSMLLVAAVTTILLAVFSYGSASTNEVIFNGHCLSHDCSQDRNSSPDNENDNDQGNNENRNSVPENKETALLMDMGYVHQSTMIIVGPSSASSWADSMM